MKLAVLGGGGVRSPQLAKSIVAKAKRLGISEIVFMDNDDEKLSIYGGLSKKMAQLMDKTISFKLTTDPIEALKDADFIITTLRVGGDRGRILDERIALSHGVLGQETTGAGGFAMAMRSIPALKEYCTIAAEYSKPDVIIFNFTNPSGLVTQALRDEGFTNVYGICDGPSEFIKELGKLLGKKDGEISVECFGLNHLSWFRSVKVNEEEMLGKLIKNPELYKSTEMRFFDRELVESTGMLLNGYLYYYYYREQALEHIVESGTTRGEMIYKINKLMHDELVKVDIDKDFYKAIEIYIKYYNMREESYMAIESKTERGDKKGININLSDEDDGGYAGVALNFIDIYVNDREGEMVLSVPNNGAIEGLFDNDVVEITCNISRGGVEPIKIGKVPEIQFSLIRQVKLFERLAVLAIKNRDIETARMALMVHPLINSYSLAKVLVDEYIEAHREYIGEWK